MLHICDDAVMHRGYLMINVAQGIEAPSRTKAASPSARTVMYRLINRARIGQAC